ncbi:MAG: TIGR00730 family Rossman fold protein [Candidatus Kerfeldbacteria bacterium]|nr:TIGR00730 family Rossman fold protein [Candidatus Kerfeldbacteria bacterium]
MPKRNSKQSAVKRNGKLVHRAPFDFKSDITWRIFRIMSEFIDGFEFLADVRRPVTFFGSARIPLGTRYYREAQQLATKLGRAGFTIITGGGPGIMEAGNKGAVRAKAESVGLNIQLPYEQRINKFVKKGIGFYYFFSRKVMLSTSAQAYVFFPGGYGTLDEFFTIITLIQTGKMERRPILLYGQEFWEPLDAFIRQTLVKDRHIDWDDAKLYAIVDSVAAAAKIVTSSKERRHWFM